MISIEVNDSQFAADLERDWRHYIMGGYVSLVQEGLLTLLTVARETTPVRTGFLLSQWGVAVNRLTFSNVGPLAAGVIAGLSAVPFVDVFVTNGADYASYVNDGTSGRPARQMVERAVQAARSIRR